jgi:hypothetical protein
MSFVASRRCDDRPAKRESQHTSRTGKMGGQVWCINTVGMNSFSSSQSLLGAEDLESGHLGGKAWAK